MLKAPVFLACAVAASVVLSAQAEVVTVGDSTASWSGYMNVFDLGGNYQWGSPWGVPDLVASFDDAAHRLTLSPNTIGDPDPYWYIGGGGSGHAGNKLMEANLYIETTGVYSGTLTFSGTVLSNSLTSAHTATIFIRDFASDYSSFNSVTVAANPGDFNISLNLVNDPTRHVQYGFQMYGVNVWATDVGPFGNVVIVPAPGALALAGLSAMAARRRR